MLNKIAIFLSLVLCFCVFYIKSLKTNINLQKEINSKLEVQLLEIDKQNELIKIDFTNREKEIENANIKYYKLQNEVDILSKLKDNDCLNVKITEELKKVLEGK